MLTLLGAVDEAGRITPHGRKLAALPCHPRIAQMLVRAGDSPVKPANDGRETANDGRESANDGKGSAVVLAAEIAAILEEKDPLAASENDASLTSRLEALHRAGRSGRWGRIAQMAEQYRMLVRDSGSRPGMTTTGERSGMTGDPYAVGALVAAAYPERVAKARPEGRGHFLLATGEQAAVSPEDPLSACEWLAVASVSVRPGREGRIFLAAPLDPNDLPELIRTRDRVVWDSKAGAAVAQRERRIGGLLVDAKPLSEGVREQLTQAICEAAQKEGMAMLDFSEEVGNLQRRVAAVAAWHPELGLPDLSTDAVLQSAPAWLPPFVGRATTVAELKKIDLCAALWTLLDYAQQQAVERLAPSHIEVPTGSRIRVEYRQGAEAPVLRVRLQECFGLLDTPRVDDGRKPVLMELLSPGYKPVQLTSDLRSFWTNTYFEVRKELRRRYPKHAWPDNPLEAEAVRGVRRKTFPDTK